MENVFNRSQSNRAEVIRIIDLFSLENAAVKSSSFIVTFYTQKRKERTTNRTLVQIGHIR